MKKSLLLLALLILLPTKGISQVDEGQLGTWYMYFWNTTIGDSPWGFQGDIQSRNWDTPGGDIEQLLIRAGLTYKPVNSNIKFTLGYGHIDTGTFGPSDETTQEGRIYQEALIPQKIGERFYLTHRLRYEQRFVETQDFRTRYRYNLFLNIPLNNTEIVAKTVYLAFYNELFINGQKNIGNGNSVTFFDRNRTYAALGYAISKDFKIQFGIMRQFTKAWDKNQLQLSVHHKF